MSTLYQYKLTYTTLSREKVEKILTLDKDLTDVSYNKGCCNYEYHKIAVFKPKQRK